MTVSCEPGMESDVSAFVHELAPGARVTYAVAHTFKFEIPTSEVRRHTPHIHAPFVASITFFTKSIGDLLH